MINKKKICFYLRNSTINQEYLYQLDELTRHFNRYNDLELAFTFAEKVSGFDSEDLRPEMKKVLEKVDNHEIDEIWVNDFARLSRDAVNLQNIVKHCADLGVNIYFRSNDLYSLDINKQLNLTTRLIISNLSIFAEMDAKNFKEKGIQGKRTKVTQNQYIGGLLPLGYTSLEGKDKKIVIDVERKQLVEYIFDSYVRKKISLGKIVQELNSLKYTNKNFEPAFKYTNKVIKSGKTTNWSSSTLRRIIKCTWYSEGYRTYKGEKIYIDKNLVFIDSDTFQKAQDLLKLNRNRIRVETKHTYLLKELLYCSCNEIMRTRFLSKNSCYVCNTNYNKRNNPNEICKHNSKSIVIEKLDNIVWLLIKNKLPEFRMTVEKKVNRSAKVNNETKHNLDIINGSKIIVENLKIRRERTITTFSKFGGNIDNLETEIKEIDKEIREQTSLIKNLENENEKLILLLQEVDIAFDIETKIIEIEADKKQIKFYMKKLIKKITVHGGLTNTKKNLISIQWNESINNDFKTFLFYNSHMSNNKFYYFFSVTDENTNVEWNEIYNSFVFNNSDSFSIGDMIVQIENIYKSKRSKIERTRKLLKNQLFNGRYILDVGLDLIKIVSPQD